MEDDQDKNVFAKVACGVVLAVIVTAAGVGLLIQHRKLDESRKARADLEKANWQLSVGREELVSANGKLAEELRALREVGRAHAADQATFEKERAAWRAEREAFSARLASAESSLKAAREAKSLVEAEVARLKAVREAKSRAEAEVARLKAAMKDMSAVEKKLRAEREKLRKERDRLERELNDAMAPAIEGEGTPVTVPVPESEPPSAPAIEAMETLAPVSPAPDLDKRTPEERAAHEKKELNDLIGL